MRSVLTTPHHAVAEAAIEAFGDEPAPLLSILHHIQTAEGHLAPEALAVVGDRCGIELAELQ